MHKVPNETVSKRFWLKMAPDASCVRNRGRQRALHQAAGQAAGRRILALTIPRISRPSA